MPWTDRIPNGVAGAASTASTWADSAYYLKRQSNHLTRSLRHPLGEPTFAREFRNIERYRALGIPPCRRRSSPSRRSAESARRSS